MGNEVTEIRKHGHFTVNIPREDLLEEVEIAGFNSRKDKLSLMGLTYTVSETVDAPLVNECPISIECEVVELVECGKLTNIIGKVSCRVVEEGLPDENGDFTGHEFSPISYIGDGSGRHYRYYSEDSLRMGSLIPKVP